MNSHPIRKVSYSKLLICSLCCAIGIGSGLGMSHPVPRGFWAGPVDDEVAISLSPNRQLQPQSDRKRFQPRKVAMCSTTQVADFTRQIVGEDWEVICVLGPGQDPHTYEVGNDDLLAVQRADLCLHNGWNLEGHDWMRVLAENAGKPLVTCTSNVTLLRVESEDGVQDVKDPHAWFDVERAMIYVQNILAGIQQADPDRAKQYQDRADAYLLKLRELDCWIREQVNSIPRNRRILVTHHDAFRYFCNAYGFQAISPMSWTTGELTDVTIEQRQAIIRKIRDLGIKSLFVESTINRELLDGIAKDAGISIGGELYSDAMGAAGTRGETYLGMMQHNVEMMVKHLR